MQSFLYIQQSIPEVSVLGIGKKEGDHEIKDHPFCTLKELINQKSYIVFLSLDTVAMS